MWFEDDLPIALRDREHLLALDEALDKLSEIDQRQGRIVELRYFGGLTIAETASLLDISERQARLGARKNLAASRNLRLVTLFLRVFHLYR